MRKDSVGKKGQQSDDCEGTEIGHKPFQLFDVQCPFRAEHLVVVPCGQGGPGVLYQPHTHTHKHTHTYKHRERGPTPLWNNALWTDPPWRTNPHVPTAPKKDNPLYVPTPLPHLTDKQKLKAGSLDFVCVRGTLHPQLL